VKTCLVICNGKGLRDIPNEFLNQYKTFGSNRIYLRYTPDYYACIAETVLSQIHDEIAGLFGCVKFVRDTHDIEGSHKLHCKQRLFFSPDPLKEVSEGWTVTFVLLQLAYYYGFERVGIVGMDHDYGKFDGTKQVITGQDDFHFTPAYFKDMKWDAPKLSESERSYRLAKKVYEDNGREIVNLSTVTKCNVFKQESWRLWMR
jgi:hypothetical protein